MKTRIPILFALTIFLVTSCKKEKQDQPLPPELRQEFNCYINGKYWTINPGGNCQKLFVMYAQDSGTIGSNPYGYLVLRGTDCNTDDEVAIAVKSVNDIKTIDLTQYALATSFEKRLRYSDSIYFDKYDSLLSGTLQIKELTPQSYKEVTNPDTGQLITEVTNGWIEGAFEMTLVSERNDTVKVTNGTFAAILR